MSLQGLSLGRQWPAVLCIPGARPSAALSVPSPWCVAMEFSSTNVLCCPAVISVFSCNIRRRFRGETIPSGRGSSHPRRRPLLCLDPLLQGPMSAIYERNTIYRISFNLFLLFMFSVTFANYTCMYVRYATPRVCVLSWIWWHDATNADSCLFDFPVHLRVL